MNIVCEHDQHHRQGRNLGDAVDLSGPRLLRCRGRCFQFLGPLSPAACPGSVAQGIYRHVSPATSLAAMSFLSVVTRSIVADLAAGGNVHDDRSGPRRDHVGVYLPLTAAQSGAVHHFTDEPFSGARRIA